MPEPAQSYGSPSHAGAQTGSDYPSSPPNSANSAQPGDALVLNESELDATFQLLVERAQYITGATGTALALPRGTEMVCRASAGSCVPKVGACMQVRSGLTGESILRRQLLRCDNAETDPRVNLEACRALGISSIVVLPLLRPNGEVRGLFELFADHPYAFEERDLIALERMADLTNTALDLAERNEPIPPALVRTAGDAPQADESASATPATAPSTVVKDVIARDIDGDKNKEAAPVEAEAAFEESSALAITAEAADAASEIAGPAAPVVSPVGQQTGAAVAARLAPAAQQAAPTPEEETSLEAPAATSQPEALWTRKCAGCGFPISGGRTLCLDCERKQKVEKAELARSQAAVVQAGGEAQAASDEMLPAFLADAKPAKQPWLGDHVNLLALAVLLVGVVVFIVVFR